MECTDQDKESSDYDVHEIRRRSKECMIGLFQNLEEPLKGFRKNTYQDYFSAYLAAQKPSLDFIESVYLSCDYPDSYLNEVADDFILHTENELALIENKRKKQEFLLDRNMALVVYINPGIVETNKSSGRELVDLILKKWKERFPETNLKFATFEEINNGFQKRFCYITTAVCESLNKPDDCYELTLLRNYRDFYLVKQDNGIELIRDYYDKAPTIVKRIDKHQERRHIYNRIWKDYLSCCIRHIEEGDNEKCLDVYQQMFQEMIDMFFIQQGQITGK